MITEAIRTGPAFSFLVLGIIIIFGPLIAERLRLPGLLGLLIGGALIGPHMLGILDDFRAIENIGQIGILYLIFLAGLQMDLETFRRFWRISGGFGMITSVIPFVLGTFLTLQLGYDTKAAILIGSFWASFTLIAYPVLKQFDLTKNRAGAATLGASAITDTVSLLVLALIAGSEMGDQTSTRLILSIALGLVILGAWCLVILPWITRWFFSTLGRGRILRFMIILVGLMSAAMVAEIVGIEPLLGAFFAGFGLNRLVPNESALMEHVDFFGNALFIPTFLVSVGLLFDPAVMFTPATMQLAVWLSLALVIGKLVAAWLTGWLFRLSRAEAGLLFSVSVAQAAATLAATIVGLELGLYGDEVVNAVMVVIAASLFITSLGTPRYAARIEQPSQEARRLGEVVLVPTGEVTERLASRLRFAGQIAEANGGVLIPVVVTEPQEDMSESRGKLVAIDDTLHSLGLEGDSKVRVDRNLAEGISQAALENNASLVLLQWPGPRSFTQMLVESLADEIIRSVDCPLAIVAASESQIERVILAISERDLWPSRIDDLNTAVSIATAAAPGKPLIVGPINSERLIETGIVLPERAEYIAGSASPAKWAEQTSNQGDLVVMVSQGRSFGRNSVEIQEMGRSVAVVAASKATRWETGQVAPRLSMINP
jgi:Kef-type K+ transport system membrane component KefB/nucleotide-binding universal stress UspA family protein